MERRTIKIAALFISLLLLFSAGNLAVRAQETQTPTGYTVFLPGVYNGSMSGHTITGQVVSSQDVPIPGVTVRTDQGQAVLTDQNGNYTLGGLQEGTYILTPSLGNTTFSPQASSVIVPPDVEKLNFTAQVACTQAIVNGGFEANSGWDIPVTVYTAGYSTSEAHSGSRSMRTGIVNPLDNQYSYSTAQQKVTLPSGTTSAYLTFWVEPFSAGMSTQALPAQPAIGSALSEVQMSGDVQYVLVLDSNYNIIKTLLWQRSDSESWTKYEYNLAAYAGKTIWLHFGTYNDGLNGISSLYVDDVSMDICPSSGSPTPSPTPGPCTNFLNNPSFETVSKWEIPLTAYPAGYSTAERHTGSWSMRTGITKSSDNIFSYSDFRQAVTIPSGATAATARFWLYTLSNESGIQAAPELIAPTGHPFSETALSADLQYVLVLDEHQNWIDTLIWQRRADGYWHYYEFNLLRYAGHTIYLQFGTYNDGLGGITSMYVDDVSLDNCITAPTPGPSPTPTATPTRTPTPTVTPTPGVCQQQIVNSDFTGTNGWVIPYTNYPAGYSYTEYHSPFRSMRTGIINPADNTYSYSDFRQAISIPSSANHVTLAMWVYPLSGELSLAGLPVPTRTQYFGLDSLAYDVQYLLVLNKDQQWIDTLVWMRSNSHTWTNLQFDLSKYAGTTIMLQWGTYNEGTGGITAMYVDDVTVQSCP